LEFGNSVYWINFGEEYAEKVTSAKIFYLHFSFFGLETDAFDCFDDGIEIPCIQAFWYQVQVSLRGNTGTSFSFIYASFLLVEYAYKGLLILALVSLSFLNLNMDRLA
jgi:hypothetical protein